MKLILHIWKQESPKTQGRFHTFNMENLSPDMSFLEMLDVLNESLVQQKNSLWLLTMTVEKGFAVLAV